MKNSLVLHPLLTLINPEDIVLHPVNIDYFVKVSYSVSTGYVPDISFYPIGQDMYRVLSCGGS